MQFDMVDYQDEEALFLLEGFEITPLMDDGPKGTYYLNNGWFGGADAYTLQGMIRLLKPNLIIEAGCGFSSLLISETTKAKHLCIDPKPRTDIDPLDLVKGPVQETSLETFDLLEPGDILFVDTSHVFWYGSELLFLFFEVLPRLKSGVVIHFHDIFLPWDYPPQWITGGYNEQYILRAMLMGGNNFKAIFPVHFMVRQYPAEIREKYGLSEKNMVGGSFWVSKT